MSFLQLKNWGLPFIALLIIFTLLFAKEVSHLKAFRHKLERLTQTPRAPKSLSKEQVIITLQKNQYCGYRKNLFYVISFGGQKEVTFWLKSLNETRQENFYPPRSKPTVFGNFQIKENSLRLEYNLYGHPTVIDFLAHDGPSEPFLILRNKESLFSPELCAIAASL
ncbi:MAG: hypothetical protein VXV96_02580 [Bdellovibrionota bacterium]|nr:hypothetical protein [Bdellovibrionota bacterium]